jgi:hypothetical protein
MMLTVISAICQSQAEVHESLTYLVSTWNRALKDWKRISHK